MSVEISNRLVELRKKKGFTQEDLANETGINNVMISKYENGSEMGLENLIKLASALETSLDYIVFGKGEKNVKYNNVRRGKTPGHKIAYAIADLCEEDLLDIDYDGNVWLQNKFGIFGFVDTYKKLMGDDDRKEKGFTQFAETKIEKFAKKFNDSALKEDNLPFF